MGDPHSEPASTVSNAIGAILREIIDGADPDSGWLLNPGDAGLLNSLDTLSAAEASVVASGGGASVAAHVEHLRYGLELLNRRARGENPFADADWTAAWSRHTISEPEWDRLRNELRKEARRWTESFGTLVGVGEPDLKDAIASAAHLAYHLGAIRQIQPAAR